MAKFNRDFQLVASQSSKNLQLVSKMPAIVRWIVSDLINKNNGIILLMKKLRKVIKPNLIWLFQKRQLCKSLDLILFQLLILSLKRFKMSCKENLFLKYCVKSVELSHICQESANNVTKFSAKPVKLSCKEMDTSFKMMLYLSKLSN